MRTLFSVSFFDFPFPSADFIRLPVAAPVSVPRLFFARFRSCGVFDQVFPLVPLFYRTFLTKRISVLRGFLLLVLARAAFFIRYSRSRHCFIALSQTDFRPARLFFARFRSCGVFDQAFLLVLLFYRTFPTKQISVLRGAAVVARCSHICSPDAALLSAPLFTPLFIICAYCHIRKMRPNRADFPPRFSRGGFFVVSCKNILFICENHV